mgnify:CR=1 FL=1
MMTAEENDLLCRVEGDAPMGQLMRRHWIPVCLSEEVVEPDGTPVRARLLLSDAHRRACAAGASWDSAVPSGSKAALQRFDVAPQPVLLNVRLVTAARVESGGRVPEAIEHALVRFIGAISVGILTILVAATLYCGRASADPA